VRYRPPKGVSPPQLEGKRTGRPKGTRNHARVWSDLDWAYANLEHDRVDPPNPNAGYWWLFGKYFPDQFTAFVESGGRPRVDD
jgi:hypothetical protein